MRVLLVDVNPFEAAVAPTALASLVAVLRAAGHRVGLLSVGGDSRLSVAGLAGMLSGFAPQLVGFAAYQRNFGHVRGLARLVREAAPAAHVVIGGPQAALMPAGALANLPEVDYIARGEGELTVLALVQALEGGLAGGPPPGVTSRDNDGAVRSAPPLTPPADLDGYPSPWLSGVLDPARWGEAVLISSRGCPHRCLFCTTPAAFGAIRCHSVERVLEEASLVTRRGSGRLWFADPNFSFSRARVVELLEGILRRGLAVSMWLETRADLVDAELLSLMRRAGAHTVAMGLESAVPRVQERLGKALDLDRVRHAVEEALAAGLEVELFSQYGLPGETREDALATLEFVRSCNVPIRGNSNAQQMQLYFGSALGDDPETHGIMPLCDRRPPYLAVGTEYETAWMSRDDLAAVRAAWRAASSDGGRRIVS
jgi:radical SAM superfamily enzyme YgiQ (UPF0313 family)